jgi:hypothetical protein
MIDLGASPMNPLVRVLGDQGADSLLHCLVLGFAAELKGYERREQATLNKLAFCQSGAELR